MKLETDAEMTSALIQVYMTYNYWISYQVTEVWKATKCAERLVEQFMVRIESTSTFNPDTNN